MRVRSLLLLFPLLCVGFCSLASGHSGGHGHGHGGGHGHTVGHSHGGGHSHVSHHYSGGSHVHFRSRSHYHRESYRRNYTVGSYRSGRPGFNPRPLVGAHEFAGGTGAVTANQLQDSSLRFATPSFFLSYRYFITNGVSLGITAGIQTLEGSSIYLNNNSQMMPFSYSQHFTTVALELNWQYLNRRHFQLYGGAGIGLSHWLEFDQDKDLSKYTETGNKVGCNLTLLGFRFGGDLGGFVELGAGYKGLVSCGLSYQAGRRRPLAYGR